MDIQVDTGDEPGGAHTGYWEKGKVIMEMAELIVENARP